MKTTLDTPIGTLVLAGDGTSLTRIWWPVEHEPGGDDVDPVLAEAKRQLAAYFAGELTTFDLPLDAGGTAWQRQVWEGLQQIPYGQTRSYGQLSASLGRPTASRAVGAANGANRLPVVVPCHRVLAADGSLHGFAGGLEAKRWLLDHERRVLARASTRLGACHP